MPHNRKDGSDMTFEEFRKLPEEEKARIRREMLSRAAEASTNLEYGGEDDSRSRFSIKIFNEASQARV